MSNVQFTDMYETRTFAEIFDDYGSFKYYYQQCQYPKMLDSDDSNNKISNLQTLYYLLYAKYGNSPIANYDENQFVYKVFGIVFQYGPSWQKRLDIQKKLREISDDDLLKGAKAIYNHAYNPETQPGTQTLEELTYINDQNTTNYKKSKMDAYTQLWNLLATDVTEEFINRFNICFKKFVKPGTYLYVSEED